MPEIAGFSHIDLTVTRLPPIGLTPNVLGFSILPPYGPIESTQIDPDELIAHLLIFSGRYDRLVAGRLGGRYEARGRHR